MTADFYATSARHDSFRSAATTTAVTVVSSARAFATAATGDTLPTMPEMHIGFRPEESP